MSDPVSIFSKKEILKNRKVIKRPLNVDLCNKNHTRLLFGIILN